jgi:hypothetical protein
MKKGVRYSVIVYGIDTGGWPLDTGSEGFFDQNLASGIQHRAISGNSIHIPQLRLFEEGLDKNYKGH